MRNTSTPATPAADAFTPIYLLEPDPAALAGLRTQVSDSDSQIEVSLRLSSEPHKHWLSMYLRLWGLYFPSIQLPTVNARSLRITSQPATLAMHLQIARVVIAWTNDLSAPLVRGEAAQFEVEKRRMKALDEFHACPRALPEITGDAGGDESTFIARMDARMFLARQEHDAEEKELRKKLALEEIDAAIATLAVA